MKDRAGGWARIYPMVVSLLGAAGLATALAYLIGVCLVIAAVWPRWTNFFVPAAIPSMALPAVLLLAHLYLRSRLGAWMLRRGRPSAAIAHCQRRLSHNLWRSRTEALIHRVTLARAYMAQGEYPSARHTLMAGFSMPDTGDQAADICRWRMEIGLRTDDLELCRRAAHQGAGLGRQATSRGYFWACRAELAAREHDRAAYEDAIEEALWAAADNPRVRLSQVIGVLRFGGADADVEHALDELDVISEAVAVEAPCRQGELVAWRAELLDRLGRPDRAAEAIELTDGLRTDTRAQQEIRRVRECIAR